MGLGYVIGANSSEDKTFFNSLGSLEKRGLVESWSIIEEIPNADMQIENDKYAGKVYGIKTLIPRSFKRKIDSFFSKIFYYK